MFTYEGLVEFVGDLKGQLIVAAVLSIVQGCIIEVTIKRVMAWVEKREWWPQAAPLQVALMKNYGFTTEQCSDHETVLSAYCFVLLFCTCHTWSGFATLPVVIYGWEGAGAAGQAWFFLGTLGDVGFDIYDWVKNFLLTFCHKKVAWWGPKVPMVFFIILCVLHHTMSMVLMIPMNLKYVYLPAYAQMVNALLLGAGLCFILGEYKFTLSMRKRWDFLQYKIIVLMQLAAIWASRFFIWFHSLYKLGMHFWKIDDMVFFGLGISLVSLFSLFNLIMVVDATKAAVKWLPKPLPKDDKELEELEAFRAVSSGNLGHMPSLTTLGLQEEREVQGAFHAVVAAAKFKRVLAAKQDAEKPLLDGA